MINYSSDKFEEPSIKFEKGIAQLDLITLIKAADVINEKLGKFNLPLKTNFETPDIFNKLTKINISSLNPLTVTATIDTKKMSWDYETGKIFKTTFTDYNGKQCYGVGTSSGLIANINELDVIKYEMKLESGQKLNMFVSDAPNISDIKLYVLWLLAQNITVKYNANETIKAHYTNIIIPALQVKYCRQMVEIEKMNSEILKINKGGFIQQKAFIALDETGVRVKAVTEMRKGAIRREPKIKIFGDKQPVMYWFADINNHIPFAVIVSNSDAWLSPNEKISFNETNFN